MHPAFSVIVFTVASGAGFGLLALMGLAPLFGVAPTGGFGWTGFALGFALAVAGLLASTRHLGRPERAWRAFSQWRSSWLSREGVLAVATLAVMGLYALAALVGGGAPMMMRIALGVLAALLSLATIYATGMIYAQLRTVRRWNTPLTPACYLAFALSGGLLLFAAVAAVWSAPTPLLPAAAALAAAWAVKLAWLRYGDRTPPLSTPETATGLGAIGRVRLLEAPHTSPNYLLKEMGFRVARKHARKLRRLALGIGGIIPLALLAAAAAGLAPAVTASAAALSHLAGMLIERWLFFAEAEHAVMTYY